MTSRIAVLLPFMLLTFANCAHTGELKTEVVSCASVENPAVEVIVKDYTFEPLEITVPAGSVVKWVNKGPTSHMVTSGAPDAGPGAVFGTPFLAIGGTACVKFVNPGTYDYFCRPHGNAMKGAKVVVE